MSPIEPPISLEGLVTILMAYTADAEPSEGSEGLIIVYMALIKPPKSLEVLVTILMSDTKPSEGPEGLVASICWHPILPLTLQGRIVVKSTSKLW